MREHTRRDRRGGRLQHDALPDRVPAFPGRADHRRGPAWRSSPWTTAPPMTAAPSWTAAPASTRHRQGAAPGELRWPGGAEQPRPGRRHRSLRLLRRLRRLPGRRGAGTAGRPPPTSWTPTSCSAGWSGPTAAVVNQAVFAPATATTSTWSIPRCRGRCRTPSCSAGRCSRSTASAIRRSCGSRQRPAVHHPGGHGGPAHRGPRRLRVLLRGPPHRLQQHHVPAPRW